MTNFRLRLETLTNKLSWRNVSAKEERLVPKRVKTCAPTGVEVGT